MSYKSFKESLLKVKLAGSYISRIFTIGLVIQVFIFSFFFTKAMKKETEFNPKIYLSSIIKNDAQTKAKHEQILQNNYQVPLLYSLSSYLLVFMFFYLFSKRKDENKIIRGSKLVELDEFIKSLNMYKYKYIRIGGYQKAKNILTEEDEICKKIDKEKEMNYRNSVIEVPEKFEYTHFCIIGRSGSGKTALINPIVAQLRERGERMVIHDYKGDFSKNFCNSKRDLIFNPTTPNTCVKWSIFNDIQSREDIRAIVASLIPAPSKSEDPFWKSAAKDILTACLIVLHESGKKTNRDIYELVSAPNEVIEKTLSQSPLTSKYIHIFDKSNVKTLNSIMSVFRTYTDCFEYLAELDGNFSIKKWVAKSRETIFVQNKESIKEAISPLLTLFIDTISRELLSQEDRDDKTVFILDEFGRLNKMSSVLDLLTNGRSKGASVYILSQEFAQIDHKYEKSGRKTIVNACSNQIYFNVNESESAEEIAKQIGESEQMMEDESINHKIDDVEMEGLNVRKHMSTKKVVMASEILNLREREFYIKLTTTPWSKSKVFIQKL